MKAAAVMLEDVINAGQDFEWYPTTARMIGAVAKDLPRRFDSVMDIGAGDGRVLLSLAKVAEHPPDLYAIEKSQLLLQAMPESITPVGCDFHEQNLASLPVDFIFSNPPYSEFEQWAIRIIENAFAQRAYLVVPRRWRSCKAITDAITKRKATWTHIFSDDFLEADRQSRAVVDIVRINFPIANDYHRKPVDPFDQWFDQNISTFDQEKTLAEDAAGTDLARVRALKTIGELVEAYNEDYARMEANYRQIFTLDFAILKELGVNKSAVRDGLKTRMAGLKTTYWQLLFEKLDAITSRLSTATKKKFLDRINGRTSVAFTYDNAFAIVMWSIKHANRYYDEQLVDLFKQLAAFDNVRNYKSNLKTWERSEWRYNDDRDRHSHYVLDYRIVVEGYSAIFAPDKNGYSFGQYDYPGNLNNRCHQMLDDMIAVFGNLGFPLQVPTWPSRNRTWQSNQWQDFIGANGETVFQAKAFINGNMHFRINQKAIKALNVEAGRLLGWLHSATDVERELGYTADEAQQLFGSNRQLTASSIRLLSGGSQ